MAKNNARKWEIGAVLAAIAGFVVGLLTAPKSGKETRKDIKDTADKSVAEAEKQLKSARAELDKTVKTAKEQAARLRGEAKLEMEAALKAADVAKAKAREIMDAARDGQANDRDLQEAINDVNKAFEHLKTYLKKI